MGTFLSESSRRGGIPLYTGDRVQSLERARGDEATRVLRFVVSNRGLCGEFDNYAVMATTAETRTVGYVVELQLNQLRATSPTSPPQRGKQIPHFSC